MVMIKKKKMKKKEKKSKSSNSYSSHDMTRHLIKYFTFRFSRYSKQYVSTVCSLGILISYDVLGRRGSEDYEKCEDKREVGRKIRRSCFLL